MAQKNKIHIEYFVKASPEMLYTYISTASGLSEWFSDTATSKGNVITFGWSGGGEETATLIARRQETLVRFRWDTDRGTPYYFELAIDQDELTGDVLLSVTDFAYDTEKTSVEQMWDTSIQNLKKLLGA